MAIKGSCHCGATQFEVSAAPETVTRCTCSFCSKRGGLWAYYTPAQFKLLTARDRVSTYQWRTYTGQHHHCSICGCGTYSEFPDFSTGKADFDNPKVERQRTAVRRLRSRCDRSRHDRRQEPLVTAAEGSTQRQSLSFSASTMALTLWRSIAESFTFDWFLTQQSELSNCARARAVLKQ